VTDSNVFQLSQPGTLSDPLTEVLSSGARALLAQAVAAEVAGFPESHADKLTDDGRKRLVRHGHLPEREIMTGIGPVAVRAPRDSEKPLSHTTSCRSWPQRPRLRGRRLCLYASVRPHGG
jgi:hypothetical protein